MTTTTLISGAVEVVTPTERPSEYFAKYVFNKEKMFKYLSSRVYNKLTDVIDNGAPLDRRLPMKWLPE